jgi:hypothetical protein
LAVSGSSQNYIWALNNYYTHERAVGRAISIKVWVMAVRQWNFGCQHRKKKLTNTVGFVVKAKEFQE